MGDAPRLPWKLSMHCKECGRGGTLDESSYRVTTTVTEKGTIGVLMFVPDRCPECRNIRVVED